MSSSTALRRLDDRVLGTGAYGPALRSALRAVVQVSQLVLLALAAVLVLAVVFVVAPVNEANAVVTAVLAGADQVAGPLRDVFALDSRPLRATANYGLAAAVYVLLATVLRRLRP